MFKLIYTGKEYALFCEKFNCVGNLPKQARSRIK